MKVLKTLLLALLLCTVTASYAQIELPAFFGDHMVLQQKDNVSIWGTDKPGGKIIIKGSWGAESTASVNSKGQWKLKINTPSYGGPYTLNIKGSNEVTLKNVMIGEVWLCSGQSNMEMPVKGFDNQPIDDSGETILNSKNSQIRLFTVKRAASLEPLEKVEGLWAEATPATVRDFSATAYFFGKKLNTLLNVPIGLIHTSWGGSSVEAWMEKEAFSEFKNIELPKERPDKGLHQTPTLLYNAMINPLIGYGIKGAIWYQGESNRNRAEEYSRLFPTMIKTWRKKWQRDEFPFYFVQIAPYGYNDGNAGFVREAQLHTMKTVENTGMAVTMDIGDCDYIHPREKKLVGDRLALWALSKDYGIDGIAFSGPVYKEIDEIKEGKIQLSFNYTDNGLSSYGQTLTGFEIAGADKVFHPAEAKINGNKSLSVWSSQVSQPVAVRYAFKNCESGSLFNTEGLPASSFRTDAWAE
ncbi:sialate O-acetylesterase [Arenibacter sp. TNZ]|jgi:sialate O-acetylesterase|uniref:sialate O-acetylesterase n=1 Tax=Arenibacter TaxID=178469 RepID=UPI000CD4999F|nr:MULTISPECIES: sialate O-acetylesterase [Arenibacter]MCM4174003.1 sialate O-acetylesterase [Arenibacter sp. TNZ]